MKKSSLIAFLFIGLVVYYVTGGGILFGVFGGSSAHQSAPQPAVPAFSQPQANPYGN